MSIRVRSGRERRSERERIEIIFTKGLYKTFAEVLVLSVISMVVFAVILGGLMYGW